jgi:hypothetical protein
VNLDKRLLYTTDGYYGSEVMWRRSGLECLVPLAGHHHGRRFVYNEAPQMDVLTRQLRVGVEPKTLRDLADQGRMWQGKRRQIMHLIAMLGGLHG